MAANRPTVVMDKSLMWLSSSALAVFDEGLRNLYCMPSFLDFFCDAHVNHFSCTVNVSAPFDARLQIMNLGDGQWAFKGIHDWTIAMI